MMGQGIDYSVDERFTTAVTRIVDYTERANHVIWTSDSRLVKIPGKSTAPFSDVT